MSLMRRETLRAQQTAEVSLTTAHLIIRPTQHHAALPGTNDVTRFMRVVFLVTDFYSLAVNAFSVKQVISKKNETCVFLKKTVLHICHIEFLVVI